MLKFILFASILVVAKGQITSWGPCPSAPQAMFPFEFNKFGGKWYELQKMGNTANERCVSFEFDPMNLIYTNEGAPVGSNTTSKSKGTINLPHLTTGIIDMIPDQDLLMIPRRFEILYTDYDTLAVMYSCVNFMNFMHIRDLWVLSRAKFTFGPVEMRVDEVLRRNNLTVTEYSHTDQYNC